MNCCWYFCGLRFCKSPLRAHCEAHLYYSISKPPLGFQQLQWCFFFPDISTSLSFQLPCRHCRADSIAVSIFIIIMNKGIGGGTGPTAAAAAAAAQKQKLLLQRVETDIANIVDNFTHLVNVSRVTLLFPFLFCFCFIVFSTQFFFDDLEWEICHVILFGWLFSCSWLNDPLFGIHNSNLAFSFP